MTIKRFEKFLIIYLPIWVLSEAVTFYYKGDGIRNMQFPGDGQFMLNFNLGVVLGLAYLKNIVVAVWLFFESKKMKISSFLWPVFGLIGGLFAVALYIITCLASNTHFEKRG